MQLGISTIRFSAFICLATAGALFGRADAASVAGATQQGTTAYPNGGITRIDSLGKETNVSAGQAATDPLTGYTYVAAGYPTATIVKLRINDGPATPTRIGALELPATDGAPASLVLDPAAGYGYMGSTGGRFVKFALGAGDAAPRRASSLFVSGDMSTSVLDPINGYAYVGLFSTPARIVKIKLNAGDAAPTLIGGLNLNLGENYPASSLIDPAGGYAWFGMSDSTGAVVKLKLGAGDAMHTRLGKTSFASGESSPYAAGLDLANGHLYYGTVSGYLVKLTIGAGDDLPVRLGRTDLTGDYYYTMEIDPAAGRGWVATGRDTGPQIIKFTLGAGVALPTQNAVLSLPAENVRPHSSVIDTAKGYALFVTQTEPARAVKVALGAGAAAPTLASALPLNGIEGYVTSGVRDEATGLLYFCNGTDPAYFMKVAPGDGTTRPRLLEKLLLASNEDTPVSIAIDSAAGYAYLGTDSSPGRVVKIDLGDRNIPMRKIGTTTMLAGENRLNSAIIDPQAGYAWFGTYTDPGRVVKVRLGAGETLPTRIGAAQLFPTERLLISAAIDKAAGIGYFLYDINASPGVAKFALGDGADSPSLISRAIVKLGNQESSGQSLALDASTGHLYVGIFGAFVKVAVGQGATTPTRVSALRFPQSGIGLVESVFLDPVHHTGLLGLAGNNLRRVALGDGDSSPTVIGSFTGAAPDGRYQSGHVDFVAGVAHLGVQEQQGDVVRAATSQRGFIKMSRVAVGEAGRAIESWFYSHRAAGKLRLGIYREDSASTRTLVWESGEIINTGGLIGAPVVAGAPLTVPLSPGAYHLAWQIDDTQDIPSYLPGTPGSGSWLFREFGPFPAQLKTNDAGTSWTTTSEAWTHSISYETESGVKREAWAGYAEGPK